MASTIDVLSLDEVTGAQTGDTLLLIRPEDGTQTPKRVDATAFKGADGEAYNVDNISAQMKRNRLTIVF